MLKSSVALFVFVTALSLTAPCWAEWRPHVVYQLNGQSAPLSQKGIFQMMSETQDGVFTIPYIVYMPEKNRILMAAGVGYPHQAVVVTSDDGGAIWSQPKYVHTGADGKSDVGMGVGLTYLGKGKLMLYSGSRWFSSDYGETWGDQSQIDTPEGMRIWAGWDPAFVDRDLKTGKLTRLIETGYSCTGDTPSGGASQAYMRSSTDEGRTWGEATKVPQWAGANEVYIARAKNRDLVAACRTEVPERFVNEIDHYEGLGISISKDNGQTWSPIKKLYDWGRHHVSIITMPNGDLVMTYVVRKGYVDAADGYPQFGVEAVVSTDNGQTWDLDHRYILAVWKGTVLGSESWWSGPFSSSSVLLPDGAILTAYGNGYRVNPKPAVPGQPTPRDTGLVRWRPNYEGFNKDTTYADAPVESDLRNKFDPATVIGRWKSSFIQQTNGKAARIKLDAQSQVVDSVWPVPAKIPYMVYMPEKDRLIMLMGTVVSFSSDHGATWSVPKSLRSDLTEPLILGMTYLGSGKLMTLSGLVSFDYGETWRQMPRVPFTYEGKTIHGWDPFHVSTDPKTGKVTRITETGYTCAGNTPSGGAAQAYMRTSADEGRTWSDTVKVPQWDGVNEVAIVRAKNGDLVGACRTVVPDRFVNELDLYEGLAVSISKDDGKTWLPISKLYDYGRHHACMVVMPGGEIVMSYAVRSGYVDSDGYKQFGVEAIVSRDNGKTWDLDHKYMLASWKSKIAGGNGWWPFTQATSTVLLPDGSLLTAFGSGHDVNQTPDGQPTGRHVGLVHWNLNTKGLNKDRDIQNAPADSDLRNVFDPAPVTW